MKRFFFVFVLFLAACEPAEPATMAPVPEPAPEVVVPETAQPDVMEEPEFEEPELEEPSVDVEPPVDEPDSEPSTEESVEVDDESTTEESAETDDEVDESTSDEPETTDESTETSTDESSESTVFTAQTLAYYDGQEDRPAYVAVDGVVYDVTSSPRWRDGAHNGFQAGRDLTRQFNNQHGDTRLSRFPVVGTYTD
jgi:predicted heme/steroid binding protein